VRALASRGDAAGLLKLLDAADPAWPTLSERAVVAFALGRVADASAIPRLAQLVTPETRPDVRICASHALREIGGPHAAAALRPALADDSFSVRTNALATLGPFVSEEDADNLTALLAEDPYWQTRARAAELLGHLRDDSTIPVLKSAVEHDRLFVARAAIKALAALGSPASLQALVDLSHTALGPQRRRYVRRVAQEMRWANSSHPEDL
jgi:HEAT repeat protein